MEKIITIILLFLLIGASILSAQASSQRSSSILGNGDPAYIFRFEVVDSESQWPIKNAKITLAESDRDITSIYTGKDGVGVIIVNNSRYLGDIEKVKIMCKRYKYWEKSLSNWDLYEGRGERIGIDTKNWKVDANMIVDALKLGNFIKKGNYRENPSATFHTEDLVNVGDYYEFKVYMEKISEQ
jgi:hypothetical protein